MSSRVFSNSWRTQFYPSSFQTFFLSQDIVKWWGKNWEPANVKVLGASTYGENKINLICDA